MVVDIYPKQSTEFTAHENGEVKTVTLSNGRVLDADIVILILFYIPVVTLFYGQVAVEKGGIKTDENCRTSVPDVYGVCDVATFPFKMYNEMRRVDHVEHARQSVEQAVKAIKASEQGETIDPYDYFPHLSSRLFDLSWEFYGDNAGEAIMFGDTYSSVSKAKFGTYWVKDGKIVGAFLEGGTPEENEVIAKAARTQSEVEDLDWLEVEGLDFAYRL